jgi:hypothetical protein
MQFRAIVSQPSARAQIGRFPQAIPLVCSSEEFGQILRAEVIFIGNRPRNLQTAHLLSVFV